MVLFQLVGEKIQEGRGHLGCKLHLYPKYYNQNILYVGYFYCIFISGVHTFYPIILICRWGNFVYYHWFILYVNLSSIVLSLEIPGKNHIKSNPINNWVCFQIRIVSHLHILLSINITSGYAPRGL